MDLILEYAERSKTLSKHDEKLIVEDDGGLAIMERRLIETEDEKQESVPEPDDEGPKSEPKPLNCPDFEEFIDNNGRKWFRRTHLWSQKKQLLKPGDVIIYKENKYPENVHGTMIVGSFDYLSDFAARAYLGEWIFVSETDGHMSTDIFGDYCPGMDCFSFATEDEIQQFVTKAIGWKCTASYFNEDSDLTPDYVKNFRKYIK